MKRIAVVLAVAALALVSWWAWDREAMMGWKREAGPVPFFGAMAVLPAVGIPITPLFVLAGATFGVGPGLLGSGVALGLNLTLCYAIARVPFPLYFGASMLITGAYAVLCVVVGDSLFEHHVVRVVVGGVVVVIAVAAGLWWWRKREDHRERDVEPPKAWPSRGVGSRTG